MTWLLDCMFFDYFQWMNFKLININGLHLQELAHKQLRKLNIDENEIFSSKENGCTFLQICRPKIRSYKLCYTRLLFIWWVSNKIFIFFYEWHLQCFFINVLFIVMMHHYEPYSLVVLGATTQKNLHHSQLSID